MTAEVLWLSAKEIEQLDISMIEIMDAVEIGFATLGRAEGEMPSKIGIHPRKNCFIQAMPCYLGGDIDRAGIKCVSAYPSNPAKGHPYISGIMLLNDPATGLPLAIMDAGLVTAWRTGAASGVYARHFGNPETTTVAIIGTGVQGRVNLLAMKESFPKLSQVHCFDIVDNVIEGFIKDMQPQLDTVHFKACADIKHAVADADVVITCTPIVESPKRTIPLAWLKDDCLIIAIDYDASIGEEVFQNAHFTCDNRTQYLQTQEQGRYFQDGYPRAADIDTDMCEICAGLKQGIRKGHRGAVLMGVASHDVMTASLFFDRAVKAGLGTKMEL